MITHSIIMRFKDGYKHVGMMGVRKYIGGDFSGINESIYELQWYMKLYYEFKYKRKIKYQTTVFCDVKNADEFEKTLKGFNLLVIHRVVKAYKVLKTTILLEEHEMVMLKLIG